jgi:hypothetical protein
MLKRTHLIAALLLALSAFALPDAARAQGCGNQNPNCIVPTAPPGTSTNQAASTAFVHQAIGAVAGGTNGQIQYNNAGALGGFTASGDATIDTSTGVVTLNTVSTAKGGTGANNATNAANDVLASNGANGSFVHIALTAVLNLACAASPATCASIFGYSNVVWYGAICDGNNARAAANTTAINAALAAGGAVYVPPGTCVVSTTTLSLAANSRFYGAGRDTSILKTLSCVPLLTVSNINNVTIEQLWLQGSDACNDWSTGRIGAINFGASFQVADWTFRNLRQSGFNSNYWNYGNAAASIFNFKFDNVSIVTTTADVPGSSIDHQTNIALALFSGTGGPRWENMAISNNQFNGSDICIHAIIFGNAYKYTINNNRSINPGGVNTFGHCTNGLSATNAYCFSVYDLNDDGNPQLNGMIIDNYCLNPIAAGIYTVPGSALTRAATSTPLLIANNEITGQTHTDVALARGAIALNTSTDITVVGNKLYANAIGINVQAQTAGVVSILANDCYSGAGGGSTCLNLQAGSNGSSNTDRRVVRGNYFEGGANSVVMVSSTGARFNEVDLSGNTVVAVGAGAGAGLSAASQFTSGVIQLKANSFTGPSSTAMLSIAGMTGNLSLAGNTFTVPSTGASGILFANLPAATNGSDIFIQDGAAVTSPCTGAGSGSRAFRQNGAWKCF